MKTISRTSPERLDAPVSLPTEGTIQVFAVWIDADDMVLPAIPPNVPARFGWAYSRGIVPGDYTINVHCYRCRQLPVPVDMEVSVAPDAGGSAGKTRAEVIATSRVELRADGQERTALRFRIDADGKADEASFSTVFKPLRDMKGKGP